jgi:hypothetical protein
MGRYGTELQQPADGYRLPTGGRAAKASKMDILAGNRHRGGTHAVSVTNNGSGVRYKRPAAAGRTNANVVRPCGTMSGSSPNHRFRQTRRKNDNDQPREPGSKNSLQVREA